MDEKSTSPVVIGEILAGKYRIERVLGAGGMGIVVEAVHVELERRVALKFMLPAAAANVAAVERFAREARASAKLRSDNIVHVTDVGTLESGMPFMVMEYLEGEDLGQILQGAGPLKVDDAVDYVLQVCAGLSEAHAAGIIHRDLKPANLFLARRDDTASVVKIVDFGISKVHAAGGVEKLTATSDLMGSPLYMSPEQLASSHDVDARTDIWSLGIILYELLAGVPPFAGDTLPQVCTAVLVSAPPPILEKRPDLPLGLSAIVAKCLEKQPDARYANVTELADALAEFAPPHSSATLGRILRLAPVTSPRSAARPPMPSEHPRLDRVAQPHGETAAPWTPAETKEAAPSSSKQTWLVVAIAAALVGVGAAFLFARPQAIAVHSLAPSQSSAAAYTPPPEPAPVPAAFAPSSRGSATATAGATPAAASAIAPTPPPSTPARKPPVAKAPAAIAPAPAPLPARSAAPVPSDVPASSAAPTPSTAPPPAPSAIPPSPTPSPSASAPPKPASPYEE